jgi:hypothetical protein
VIKVHVLLFIESYVIYLCINLRLSISPSRLQHGGHSSLCHPLWSISYDELPYTEESFVVGRIKEVCYIPDVKLVKTLELQLSLVGRIELSLTQVAFYATERKAMMDTETEMQMKAMTFCKTEAQVIKHSNQGAPVVYTVPELQLGCCQTSIGSIMPYQWS